MFIQWHLKLIETIDLHIYLCVCTLAIIIIIIIFIRFIKNILYKAHKYVKSKHVIIQKSTMTTSVYKNMIYRKLIEDIHVVMVRSTKTSSSFVIAQLLKTV